MNVESTPDLLPNRMPIGPKRRRALGIAAVAAVALVAGGAAVKHSTSHADPGPKAEVPDVPRVEGTSLSYSVSFAKRAGIQLVVAETRAFQPNVQAVGTTDFDPARVAVVGTRLRGMVGRVVKFEGDIVKQGELLATIESPELAEAQATVQHYEAEKDAAELNAKREIDLAQRNLSTAREAELAKVELRKFEALFAAAKQRVRALAGGGANRSENLGAQELRSPIGGTVVQTLVSAGQSVEGNHAAFKIADLDRLWVDVKVFDQSLPLVRVGDQVDLRPLNSNAEKFQGQVARLGATIDPETRSVSVRVEIDNRTRKLRAGQSVSAVIHTTGSGDATSTVIPFSSVTYVDGQPTVFVSVSPGQVQIRHVKLGPAANELVQVESGIQPGDQVVAEGAFALKSELFR